MEFSAIVSTINAMCAFIQAGEIVAEHVRRDIFHTVETQTVSQEDADKLRAAFATYSDEETNEIARRIQHCRKMFIEQFDGAQRRRCFRSVLGLAQI